MSDTVRKKFNDHVFAPDPVAGLETFVDEHSTDNLLADAIQTAGGEIRSELGRRWRDANLPLPSNQDVWAALSRFAKACKDTNDHGKRRMLFNGTFNSLSLEFYDNGDAAIFWPKVIALDYADLHFLDEFLNLFEKESEAQAQDARLMGPDSIFGDSNPKPLRFHLGSDKATRSRRLARHDLAIIGEDPRWGAAVYPTAFAYRMRDFAMKDFWRDPRFVYTKAANRDSSQ